MGQRSTQRNLQMRLYLDESEIVRALDLHDSLLKSCAFGELAFSSFLEQYDTFPMRYALDGHESDEEEKLILAKLATRINVHFRVWNEILTGICSDDHATEAQYIQAGRFGSVEALRRLRNIVREEFP